MSDKFNKIYDQSINNPEKFWEEAANDIFWFKKPTKILNKSNPPFFKWYEDGITNTCYNALDIHIDQGNGKRTALIYDSPITGNKSKFSYEELRSKVSIFAGALKDQGVNKGDRVIIYMPMIPEAVVAMLACARIGAIHSVVFGGFASNELASRIDDSKAKVLVTASCGFEPGRTVEYKPLVDEAIKLANHKIDKMILFQRSGHEVKLNAPKEVSWEEVVSKANEVDCVEMNSNEFAYILYTSGTTGTPKGIVRDIGGHIVALKWTMKNIYNIDAGDIWWSASDIGWIVGHSYIVYAPLFKGCTTVLFEGNSGSIDCFQWTRCQVGLDRVTGWLSLDQTFANDPISLDLKNIEQTICQTDFVFCFSKLGLDRVHGQQTFGRNFQSRHSAFRVCLDVRFCLDQSADKARKLISAFIEHFWRGRKNEPSNISTASELNIIVAQRSFGRWIEIREHNASINVAPSQRRYDIRRGYVDHLCLDAVLIEKRFGKELGVGTHGRPDGLAFES